MKKYFFPILAAFALLVVFPAEAMLILLHIPKTAGTTLHSLLVPNFKAADVYLNRCLLKPARLSKWPQERMTYILNHKFVSGHFPFWFYKKNDPQFDQNFIVTVLRDPVQRVISFWTYTNERRKLKDLEPITSPLNVYPYNAMCKMLSSDPSLNGEQLLMNSIESLQRINFIIFQDDFDHGVRVLFDKLNFPIPQEIPVLNASTKMEVSEEIIEKIKELNALDMQLYQFANQYLREKFRE